jgi:hypothetical protein
VELQEFGRNIGTPVGKGVDCFVFGRIPTHEGSAACQDFITHFQISHGDNAAMVVYRHQCIGGKILCPADQGHSTGQLMIFVVQVPFVCMAKDSLLERIQAIATKMFAGRHPQQTQQTCPNDDKSSHYSYCYRELVIAVAAD